MSLVAALPGRLGVGCRRRHVVGRRRFGRRLEMARLVGALVRRSLAETFAACRRVSDRRRRPSPTSRSVVRASVGDKPPGHDGGAVDRHGVAEVVLLIGGN